jgi:MFS family permease
MTQATDRATATATVAVAAAGTLLAMISYTAPLASLHAIAVDLGSGPAGQSWILSSMSLGLTAALLTCGALGDDYGRRRMFAIGAAVLAVASALGAASPGTLLFVVGRVVEGVGTAALIACSLALISAAVPPGPERARASGIWGAALAAGIALGPLVAVVLPWRLMYALIAVAAVVLAVVARALLTESTSGADRPVDLPGMVLLAGGLAALLAALTEIRQPGATTLAVVLLVVGLLALAGFVAVQLRSAHPMMELRLFRNPALVAATVSALVMGLGVIAMMSYLAALMQRGMGYDVGTTALVLLGWSATSIVTALLTRRISERVSGAARLVGGLVLVAAGLAMLTLLEPGSGLVLPVAALVVAGLGTGVGNATMGREAVASVPPDRAGMGSGINNTSRYLGAAVGVTLVAVLSSPTGTETPAQLLAGWDTAAITLTIVTAAGALVVAACERRRRAAA